QFHDLTLEMFKSSFESFGQLSTNTLQRFRYFLKHIPNEINVYESSPLFFYLELFRNGLVSRFDLEKLSDIELVTAIRGRILDGVDQLLDVFVYENDRENLIKDSR